jgi:hypothetical protein
VPTRFVAKEETTSCSGTGAKTSWTAASATTSQMPATAWQIASSEAGEAETGPSPTGSTSCSAAPRSASAARSGRAPASRAPPGDVPSSRRSRP